jgi:hypothetical protein
MAKARGQKRDSLGRFAPSDVSRRLSRVGEAGKRRERNYRAAGADLRRDGAKLAKARETDKRAKGFKRQVAKRMGI